MNELDQLIGKFWNGRTTDEENHRLLQLLEQQGEQHRQQAQDQFGKSEPSTEQLLSEEKAQQLLAQIHSRYHIVQHLPRRHSWLRRSWIGLSAAACLLILAGIFLFRPKRQASESTATPVAAVAPARLMRVTNTSDTVMTIALKDGSLVRLQKNSGISYYEPFINDRRDVSLSGIAMFKVAKDKARPFSVYAGGTITRVLGTRFLVNASGGPNVTVRLLEGSIAVETRPSGSPGEKAVLLRTGQEIAVNKLNHSYTLRTAESAPINGTRGVSAAKDKTGLAFNKEPLNKVFRKIGAGYGITFSYDAKEIRGLYFTGTILPSDELNSVLASICNVNDLSFTRQGDTVIVTKQLH